MGTQECLGYSVLETCEHPDPLPQFAVQPLTVTSAFAAVAACPMSPSAYSMFQKLKRCKCTGRGDVRAPPLELATKQA